MKFPSFSFVQILSLSIFLFLTTFAVNAQSILRTIPSGASVTDEKDKVVGETPLDITQLLEKTKTITVKKEGYDPVTITLAEKIKKTLPFPSCIQNCNDCSVIFDAYPQEKNNYSGTLVLYKKEVEYDDNISITIDTPLLKLSPEEEIGFINGSRKKMSTKDIHYYIGYTQNMDLQVLYAFRGSFIEPVFIHMDEKEKTKLYRSKIILQPEITKLKFDLEGNLLRDYKGPCLMECNWNVYLLSDSKNKIATIPVKSSMYRGRENYEVILHELIAVSEKDLLTIDTLYSYFNKLQTEYLSKISFPPLSLKAPGKHVIPGKKEMLKETSLSVVTVETEKGFGSGVIVSSEGYIVTNHHVIEEGGEIFVRLSGNKKFKAEVIRASSDFDLALLKITTTDLHATKIGNSDDTSNGDEVFAIGTPLDKSLGQTITKGIISGYRKWNGIHFIQTDVSINQGNSGGPLINENGEVVGITTLKLNGRNVQGIGFCLPSNLVLQKLGLVFK